MHAKISVRGRALVVLLCAAMSLTVVPSGGRLSAGMVNRWLRLNDGLYGSSVTSLMQTGSGVFVAGTATEGIYMSSDGAKTWVWRGMGLKNIGTGAVPAYPRVMSVVASATALWACTASGIYASTDGGAAWTLLSADLAQMQVNTVALSPFDASLALAGTNNGVFRSVDGGLHWGAVNVSMRDAAVHQLLFDRWTPASAYAASSSGFFKSQDGGVTWRLLSSELTGVSLTCVAQYPKSARPDTLYVGSGTGVFRSFDGGGTWAPLMGADGTRPSVISLAIDEFDPMLVTVLAKQGIFISRDAGETWVQTLTVASDHSLAAGVVLAVVPRESALVGSRDGIARWDGAFLSNASTGLGFINVSAVAYDPNYHMQYAVRGVSLYSRTAVTSWQLLNGDLGNSEVYGLAVDRTQPRVLYAATGYGLLRSVDGGNGWVQIAVTSSDVRGKVLSVAVDPVESQLLYAGNTYGLYRNSYGLESTWETVGTAGMSPVIGVAVMPSNRNTIYVLTPTALWKTTDRCKSWARVSGSLDTLGATSLAVVPSAEGMLFLGTRTGVLVSTDDGKAWNRAGVGLGSEVVNSVCVVDETGKNLLAGGRTGAYVSEAFDDGTPPILSVLSPANGVIVTVPQVTISGTVWDGESAVASLTVNGSNLQPDLTTGAFSSLIPLSSGANTISVVASDLAGNRVERTISVLYQRPATVLVLHVGSQTMSVSGGLSVLLDAAPTIMRSRTLLPIRAVAEALGGTVGWDAATRTATVTLGGHQVSLQIGSSVAVLDGVRTPIDSADALVVPVILSGRTLLPVRFVAESLGCQVDWLAPEQRITITYPAP